MTKVVVKGESVYQCGECNRRIRVPTNRQGIDILQRCIITYGCRGSLRRLTQSNEINSTPAFPPEVQGIQDWFQRRVFYTHTQPVDAQVWTIVHNLANRPIIHAFVYALVDSKKVLVPTDNFTTRTIDLNTTEVTFTSPNSGIIQAISLTSQNTSNPQLSAPSITGTLSQITSNTGELTLATRAVSTDNWSSTNVNVTIEYATIPPTVIQYTNIDDTPSIQSPWVGVQRIVANGKVYIVRSLNLTNTIPAPAVFASGQIPNGTPFRITQINNTVITPSDVLLLTANSPYAAVDRQTDKYIDAGRVDSIFTYDTGKGVAPAGAIRSIYPFIAVV